MAANNYKPLNRNNEWNTAQKAAIKKAFVSAETAAAAGTHAWNTTVRSAMSQILDPHLSAGEAHGLKRLLDGIGDAIVAANTSYDVVQHITGFEMSQSKRKVIKALAQNTVAQIV